MNLLIYGTAEEKDLIIKYIRMQACMAFRMIRYFHADHYDSYVKLLKTENYDMIFVTMDNAAGMEGVVAAKNMHPDVSVIWFTNDKNFVAQSYRLGVTYFAVKPFTEKTIQLAAARSMRREDVVYD